MSQKNRDGTPKVLDVKPDSKLDDNRKNHLAKKDRTQGDAVTNFRPITCLVLMWKLFTGRVSVELYEHLDKQNLLPEEQKGCRRNSRGTKD